MLPVQAYMGGLPAGATGAPVASAVAAVPMTNGGRIPLGVPANAAYGANVQAVPTAINQQTMVAGAIPEQAPANGNMPRAANSNETSGLVTELGLTAADLAAQNVVYTNVAKGAIGSAFNIAVPTAAQAASGVVNHSLNAAVGAAGAGLSAAVGTVGAVIHASNDRTELLNNYRPILSQLYGVAPEKVTQEMLYEAAERPENSALKQQLDTIGDKAVGTSVRGAVAGVAGALAGAGAAALSFVPTAGLGSTAAFIGGSFAGSIAANKAMDWVAGSEYHTAYDAALGMQAKLQRREPITVTEMFDMHLALNEGEALKLKEKMGAEFRELDDAAKIRAMDRFPELRDQSKHEVALVMGGKLQALDLLRGDVQHALSQIFKSDTQGIVPGSRVASQSVAMQPIYVQPPQAPVQGGNRFQAGFANGVTQERTAPGVNPTQQV